MEAHIGLDYIVENREFGKKLATALDTNNVLVKKQVIDLLAALCAHSAEGKKRALDALEHYKEAKLERYRFKVLVDEVKHSTASDYLTALLAFINSIINSTAKLKDRIRVRNEFIGLKLLECLFHLRSLGSALDPDLIIQLDIFDEQKTADDLQQTGPDNVDLNSHLDVFYAILRQIVESPLEGPFLSILQHLLQVDPNEGISDVIWDTAEKLVYRATLSEKKEDAEKLLHSPGYAILDLLKEGKCYCSCHKEGEGTERHSRHKNAVTNLDGVVCPDGLAPPPPPPPPQSGTGPPPPPPFSGLPPPPPTQSTVKPMKEPTITPEMDKVRLPQQQTPQPKTKMKTLNWNRIPVHKVIGKNNLWTQVGQTSNEFQFDYESMEELFKQAGPEDRIRSRNMGSDSDRRKNDSLEENYAGRSSKTVNLLEGKRSLNVNIFLKQFKSRYEEIIELIRTVNSRKIGAEKLRGLLKILPEPDETDMLRAYDGDKNRLGNAEKFFLLLMDVSDYKLRLESMLLREEFRANVDYLKLSIDAVILASEDLKSNKGLQEIIFMVLVAGNFLNAGGYAGNAAGFRLTSLQKLVDIRANKPRMNLMHYVALQAQKKDPKLLVFADTMKYLVEAARLSIESLKSEVTNLDNRFNSICGQVKEADPQIQANMNDFIKWAKDDLYELRDDLEEIEFLRVELADFFCEDVKTFTLEETFKIFNNFCQKFKRAVEENLQRKIQEERAEAKRRQREMEKARRKLSDEKCQSDTEGIDKRRLVRTTSEGRRSIGSHYWSKRGSEAEQERLNNLRRIHGMPNGTGLKDEENGQQMDNFESGYNSDTAIKKRFRKSLDTSDDEDLLDFLKQGAEPHRKLKRPASMVEGYGSLGRSFERIKHRNKVFEMFNDRERVSSTTDNNDGSEKPKGWRNKIEEWLNESQAGNRPTSMVDDTTKRDKKWDSVINSNDVESLLRNRESGRDWKRDSFASTDNESDLTDDSNIPSPRWANHMRKSDVQKAIQTVEEEQLKDKSPWRKSTLNMPNSCQEIENERRHRRLRHISQGIDSELNVIQENDLIVEKLKPTSSTTTTTTNTTITSATNKDTSPSGTWPRRLSHPDSSSVLSAVSKFEQKGRYSDTSQSTISDTSPNLHVTRISNVSTESQTPPKINEDTRTMSKSHDQNKQKTEDLKSPTSPTKADDWWRRKDARNMENEESQSPNALKHFEPTSCPATPLLQPRFRSNTESPSPREEDLSPTKIDRLPPDSGIARLARKFLNKAGSLDKKTPHDFTKKDAERSSSGDSDSVVIPLQRSSSLRMNWRERPRLENEPSHQPDSISSKSFQEPVLSRIQRRFQSNVETVNVQKALQEHVLKQVEPENENVSKFDRYDPLRKTFREKRDREHFNTLPSRSEFDRNSEQRSSSWRDKFQPDYDRIDTNPEKITTLTWKGKTSPVRNDLEKKCDSTSQITHCQQPGDNLSQQGIPEYDRSKLQLNIKTRSINTIENKTIDLASKSHNSKSVSVKSPGSEMSGKNMNIEHNDGSSGSDNSQPSSPSKLSRVMRLSTQFIEGSTLESTGSKRWKNSPEPKEIDLALRQNRSKFENALSKYERNVSPDKKETSVTFVAPWRHKSQQGIEYNDQKVTLEGKPLLMHNSKSSSSHPKPLWQRAFDIEKELESGDSTPKVRQSDTDGSDTETDLISPGERDEGFETETHSSLSAASQHTNSSCTLDVDFTDSPRNTKLIRLLNSKVPQPNEITNALIKLSNKKENTNSGRPRQRTDKDVPTASFVVKSRVPTCPPPQEPPPQLPIEIAHNEAKLVISSHRKISTIESPVSETQKLASKFGPTISRSGSLRMEGGKERQPLQRSQTISSQAKVSSRSVIKMQPQMGLRVRSRQNLATSSANQSLRSSRNSLSSEPPLINHREDSDSTSNSSQPSSHNGSVGESYIMQKTNIAPKKKSLSNIFQSLTRSKNKEQDSKSISIPSQRKNSTSKFKGSRTDSCSSIDSRCSSVSRLSNSSKLSNDKQRRSSHSGTSKSNGPSLSFNRSVRKTRESLPDFEAINTGEISIKSSKAVIHLNKPSFAAPTLSSIQKNSNRTSRT